MKIRKYFLFLSLKKWILTILKATWRSPGSSTLQDIGRYSVLLLRFAIYDSIAKTFDTGDFNNEIVWILSEEVFYDLNIAFTMCRFAFKTETKEIRLTKEKLSVWQQNGFLFQWTVFKFHFSTRNWLINAIFSKKWVLYMHFFFIKNTFVQQLVSFK